jgi:phosphatidylglycerophosphate synthase
MVLLRVLLCPVLVIGARRGWPGRWLGLIVLVALLDDIYDGVLARRWHCDTPLLRRADTSADTIFYLGVALTLWLLFPTILRANWKLLLALGLAELTRHAFDRYKFGKAASYHSYLAKCWGLVMGLAVIGFLVFGGPRWMIPASVLVGIVADAEGLAMSLILPRWQNDVKTLGAAWRLRSAMLREEGAEASATR